MLSKTDRSQLRSDLFRHLDGVVIASSAYLFHQKNITSWMLEKQNFSLEEITEKFDANDGYLNVALHNFASQGWLSQTIDNKKDQVSFSITDKTQEAFQSFGLYEKSYHYLKASENFSSKAIEINQLLKLEEVFYHYCKDFSKDVELAEDSIQFQIKKHIEGVILGPILVHLGMNGMFHKYFMETRFKTEEFHKDAANFERLLDILTHFGLFHKIKGFFEFTDKGLFFAKRASAYGVTISYLPTLRNLEELIFGNPLLLQSAVGEDEKHVDREMNVWGSGGAHTAYFKVLDEIIIDIFNQPISQQPKGILDMGCGNGAFLQHLFNLIEKQTLRGKMLDEHPLLLIGVDFNQTAIRVTKANLIQAEIWAKIVWGDIGDPERLAKDLIDDYDIELENVLNVRSFLDHNRVWNEPKNQEINRESTSTGAFSHKGKRISNNKAEESLKEHFEKWAPYLQKFGLLTIELHTVPPHLIAENLGKTAVTAYDATHGYSDQYIVEVDVYKKVLAETGLIADEAHFVKFPNNDLAAVTVNLFKTEN